MPAPAAVSTTDDAPEVAAAIAVLAERAALLHRGGGASLLDCFAAIPDPRSKRGVRHGLPTILGLCTAAVASGCVSLVEITDWVTHADQELLAGVGARQDRSGRHVPPHPDTIERVFAALGAQGLADQLGAYLGRRAGLGPVAAPVAGPTLLPALAIDGKAVKGAIGTDGQIPYLLAAATHQNSTVIAERLIGAKTNEVPEFAPLLRGLPLGGWVLTIDAAHTVRAHAHSRRRGTPRALRDDRETEHQGPVRAAERPGLDQCPGLTPRRGHRPRAPGDPHHPSDGRPR